jgi:hypothetical protein
LFVARTERRRRILASAFCGSLVAAAGLAQSARFLEPPAGERLEPGSIVRVSWTLGSLTERDFDEMELVLSLDGGQSFPLRVTRDVSTAAESLLWRVPRLPSAHARLGLRTGSGERKETETIRIVGGEFTILAGTGDPLEEIRRVRGEWRTREAAGGANDLPERSLSGAPEEVRAAFPSERAAEVPGSPASTPERGGSQGLQLQEATRATGRLPVPMTRASLSLPLRQ